MSIDLIWNKALSLMRMQDHISAPTKLKAFRAHFGTSPQIAASLWDRLICRLQGAKPRHLLCTLYFLRNYNTEFVTQGFTGMDPKTFRKWCWKIIELIAFDLDVVTRE